MLILNLTNAVAKKPTEKMLKGVNTIIRWLGKEVPDDVYTDFGSCATFLDSYLNTAVRKAQDYYQWQRSRPCTGRYSGTGGYDDYENCDGWSAMDVYDQADFY